MNFKSLQGSSLYSSDAISGTNFDKWYDNVLWARGKEEQRIAGFWEVKKLQITNDATGNGLINDVSIHEIEKNLQSSISSIDDAIKDHSGKYQQLCRELGIKANESQSSVYIIKHFELDFKISEDDDIFSYFAFETHENFLAVNTNCTTHLYKWNRREERFKKLASVVTGVVYNWLLVKNVRKDVFIITNSRMEANYPCMFGGLNVWKMNEDQLFHVSTISKETDILELHANQQQPGRFFTLNNMDEVTHYDVFGEKKEFWKLPEDRYNYSFIPPEVMTKLTLFNGHNVYSLDSKFKSRRGRAWDQFAPRLTKVQSETMPVDSPIYRFKMPDGSQLKQTMPTIPAKQLISSDKREHFVTRIRQIGDAVRKSLSETFRDIPKITVKNSSAKFAKDSQIFNIKAQTPMVAVAVERSTNSEEDQQTIAANRSSNAEESVSNPATSASPTAMTVPRTFSQTPRTEISVISTTTAASPTETLDLNESSKLAKSENKTRPTPDDGRNETLGFDFLNPWNSVKKSLEGVEKISSRPHWQAPPTQRPDPLIDTLKKIGGGIKSAYNKVEKTLVGSEQNGITKTEEVTSDEQTSATTSGLNWTSQSVPAASISTSKLEASNEVSSISIPDADLNKKNDENTTAQSLHLKESPSFSLAPKILFPPENQNAIGNLKSPEGSTIFPELFQVNKDEDGLEQQVPIEILTGSGVRITENPFIPEHGTGEFIMMYVGPPQRKQTLFAVTRTRDAKVQGNHNQIEVNCENWKRTFPLITFRCRFSTTSSKVQPSS